MTAPQSKLTDEAIDTAIAEFIAAIEALANHAPVRSALRASAIYKLIPRMAEGTPDKRSFVEYVEAAATELRDVLSGDGAT